MKKETYKIHGDTLRQLCVATSEKALSKTAGVHSASVNFATESALIEFDESAVSEQNLANAVKSMVIILKLVLQKRKKIKMLNMDMNTRT